MGRTTHLARDGGSPPLESLLRAATDRPDEELAELIRSDGRRRIARGEDLELRAYLDAIADLPHRPLALDAAIDLTLRSLSGSSRPTPEAIETLADNYPELAAAIREAAALSEALWSTNRLAAPRSPIDRLQETREFGPPLADGEARYELLERLGSGAHGEVFLARDRQLSDTSSPALVAIKTLRAGGLESPLFGALLDEAIKARRLSHPNVVRVIDAGVLPSGEEFVVYEHVQGLPLDEWVRRRGGCSARVAAELARSVVRGLHAAHAARLAHRDLKPANILVDEEGRPRIADFGVADRTDAPAPRMNGASSRLGNIAFMPPERWVDDGAGGLPAADLYSAGGLLFWLLTGDLPNGSTRSEIERSLSQGGRSEAELRQALRRGGVERDLSAICARALAPDPKRRHDSASQLAEDLEAWLERRPIRWTHPSAARIGLLWARRRPGLAAAVGFVCLLGVGSIVGLATAVRFGALAHEKEMQARVTEARLGEEQRLKVEHAVEVFHAAGKLRDSARMGVAAEALTVVWVYEWVFGPELFPSPERFAPLWDELRIELIGTLYKKSERASPTGESARTLLLGLPLGLWHIHAGEARKALPILEKTLAGWEARTYAEDPWLERIEALIACAKADLALADSATTIDALRAHIGTLLAYEQACAAMTDSEQIRFILLDRARALARSERVDDVALVEELTEQIRILDVSGTE